MHTDPSEGVLCLMPDEFLSEYRKQGVVMFVPTMRFLKRLRIMPREYMNTLHTSEWYNAEHAGYI